MDETLNLVININVNEKVENRWIVPLIYGFFVFFFIYIFPWRIKSVYPV